MKLRRKSDNQEEGFQFIEDYIQKHPPLSEDFQTMKAEKLEAKDYGAKSWEINHKCDSSKFA